MSSSKITKMADLKQLVLVVESTAALGAYWPTILSDYLQKIISSFCGDEDTEPATPIPEMTLVNFNVRESNSSSLVQKSGWTKTMSVFMRWLSSIKFRGDGFYDAAIAEGLAEVLKMFPERRTQNHERHCILIAASNPYPLPTPVYKPPNFLQIRSESHFADAITVAKYFKQCRISLSVISPRRIYKLRAIYNAAKTNPSETDPIVDNVKNPDYLVLISESFMEARSALSQPEITNLPLIQSPIRMDIPPVSDPVSVMSSASSSPLSTSQEMTSSSNDHVQSSNPVVSATITKQPPLVDPNVVHVDVATNVGPAPQRYEKLWEGNLTGFSNRQRKHVVMTKLQCYRNTGVSESLADDWPPTMQIEKLAPQNWMNNRKYKGKVDYLVFQAMSEHLFLGEMQEKKLGAFIKLPSHTLLLCVSDKCRLVGMLFPKEMVIYKPQMSEQPQMGQDSLKGKQSSCIDLNN